MLMSNDIYIDEVREDEDEIFIQITKYNCTIVLTFEEFDTCLALLRRPHQSFKPFMSLQKAAPDTFILEFGKGGVYVRFRLNVEDCDALATHLEKEYANPG